MLIYDPVKLRALRKQRKFSQATLAKRAGLSQATISALEKGEPDVKHATLVQVAAALGVPLRDIMKRPTKAGEAQQIDDAIALAMALDAQTAAAWIAAGKALLNGSSGKDS